MTCTVSRHEIWELATLPAVRSVIDKYLICCLRDPLVRRFFDECDLQSLKPIQIERLLAALGRVRIIFDADKQAAPKKRSRPASLKALKALTEEKLNHFKAHLAEAMDESLSERIGKGRAVGRLEAMRNAVGLLLEADETLLVEMLPRSESLDDPTVPTNKTVSLKNKIESNEKGNVFLGTEFTPVLNVPMLRRQQALAVAILTNSPVIFFIVLWLAIGIKAIAILIVFGCSLHAFHVWQCPVLTAPLSHFLRRNEFLRTCAQYFPAALIKSDPAHTWDTSKAYLVGCNPHGVFSIGAALSFGTDVLGWREKFNGIEPRISSILMNLKIPLLSNVLARMGFVEVSTKQPLMSLLSPGRAVFVKLGNSREAVSASPGQHVLSFGSKSDFFVTALKSGASLVPCFTFGEESLFECREAHGVAHDFQVWFERQFGIFIPIFQGRSLFAYNVGFMPRRRPLFTVVGSPIPVERVAEPSDEQIDALREEYISRLRELFQEWQPQCEPESNAELMII